MEWVKTLGLLMSMGCLLGAQSLNEDPVMKARQQRSQAQGINEADLPAVPRAITDPPPLPPPETHAKDSPHPPVAKAMGRRAAARLAKQGKAAGTVRGAKGSRGKAGPRLAAKAGPRTAAKAGPGAKARSATKLIRKPKKKASA